MIKQLIILSLFVLIPSCCFAQEFEDEKPGKNSPNAKKIKNTAKKGSVLTLTVQANHDFYLKVDGNSYGKILKATSKAVQLRVGEHTIAFEEADSTGERIEQFVTVTDDMVRTKDSVYIVFFKNDFGDILNPSDEVKTSGEIKPINEQDTKNKALLDKILADMILIKGGSFTMGNEGEKDEAEHNVTVSAFQLNKYEVTQAHWQAVMGYNRSGHQGCNECPVENVSWNEVNDFIQKINKIGTKQFRLPTEAEWEYVARKSYEKEVGIPTSIREFEIKWKNALDRTAVYNNRTNKSTQPVGERKPFFEVFDLMGNVAEWCSDYYKSEYQNDNPSNPHGPATGEKKLIKGGSFKDSEKTLHISMRESEAPGSQKKTVGFRLASDAN